jgi:hypothetical protein
MRELIVLSGRPDPEQRRCYDCRHLKAAVSWWCRSPEATERRGTAIPGTQDCPEWEPARVYADLSWQERFWLAFDPFTVRVRCEE